MAVLVGEQRRGVTLEHAGVSRRDPGVEIETADWLYREQRSVSCQVSKM